MVDAAGTVTEVSRQLWAMLSPLFASDSHQAGMVANVERHNGLEAWRRIAEPINEDKAHVRRNFLATVTIPKCATSMGNIEAAVEVWNTNIRLFVAADGEEPTDDAKRMTLIQMFPMDISVYGSLHNGMKQYGTFAALKRFVFLQVCAHAPVSQACWPTSRALV